MTNPQKLSSASEADRCMLSPPARNLFSMADSIKPPAIGGRHRTSTPKIRETRCSHSVMHATTLLSPRQQRAVQPSDVAIGGRGSGITLAGSVYSLSTSRKRSESIFRCDLSKTDKGRCGNEPIKGTERRSVLPPECRPAESAGHRSGRKLLRKLMYPSGKMGWYAVSMPLCREYRL